MLDDKKNCLDGNLLLLLHFFVNDDMASVFLETNYNNIKYL